LQVLVCSIDPSPQIEIHDHLVFGREGVASFKALGLI
jgi:DNA repair protein RadC